MRFIGSDISEVLICDITEKYDYNLNTTQWITSSSVWCVSWGCWLSAVVGGTCEQVIEGPYSSCFSLFWPYLFEKLLLGFFPSNMSQ